MPEWLTDVLIDDSMEPLRRMVIRLLIAFGFGCIAALIHAFTCGRPLAKVDRSFLATLILLATLIALVILVVGKNTARAFSLAGALAIVRFRTIVEDTRDTAFVIYAVVSGMAAGAGYAEGALVCTPLVFLTAWVLRPQTGASSNEGVLVLRLAVGRPVDARVDAVLKKHLPGYRLSGVSTARGGSALDATYIIRMPAAEQLFALVNELGSVEGVQNVELKGG
jgi:hypothetical protein